jgi:flagellar biosynthesis protein FlhG
VLAVTSGKGGVGKTNVAVNLSIALSRKGLRVLLMDADLGLANVDVILGMIPQYNLMHVLKV